MGRKSLFSGKNYPESAHLPAIAVARKSTKNHAFWPWLFLQEAWNLREDLTQNRTSFKACAASFKGSARVLIWGRKWTPPISSVWFCLQLSLQFQHVLRRFLSLGPCDSSKRPQSQLQCCCTLHCLGFGSHLTNLCHTPVVHLLSSLPDGDETITYKSWELNRTESNLKALTWNLNQIAVVLGGNLSNHLLTGWSWSATLQASLSALPGPRQLVQ